MFGLGGQEILLLLCCGAIPAVGGVVLFVVLSARSKRERALEDKNRELRRRLDERKDSGQ
jgi:hypothetical protein